MPDHTDLHVPHAYVPIKPWRLYMRIALSLLVAMGTTPPLITLALGAMWIIDGIGVILFVCIVLLLLFSLMNIFYTVMLLKFRTRLYYIRSDDVHRIFSILLLLFIGGVLMFWASNMDFSPD